MTISSENKKPKFTWNYEHMWNDDFDITHQAGSWFLGVRSNRALEIALKEHLLKDNSNTLIPVENIKHARFIISQFKEKDSLLDDSLKLNSCETTDKKYFLRRSYTQDKWIATMGPRHPKNDASESQLSYTAISQNRLQAIRELEKAIKSSSV